LKKIMTRLVKHKLVMGGIGVAAACGVAGAVVFGMHLPQANASEIDMLSGGWPTTFSGDSYEEPEFVDSKDRTNHAFNVADFGEQGNNGWFYRYGESQKPTESRRLESYNGEKYYQIGATGLEVKSNFIHTAEGVAPILEWRAAEDGKVNIQMTYVKNVNMDKNPGYPDGVTLYVYKGEEPLGRYEVDISTDKEELLEEVLKDIAVKEGESLYFAVDPNMNNAYDGGSLYVAIDDVNTKLPGVRKDTSRVDNNANNQDDFGYQGKNGWSYLCGKGVKDAHVVTTQKGETYMNTTSPNLEMSKFFVHPALNDAAIVAWQPAKNGAVELRMKYTKFEQNDGNPEWPDGVVVSVYKNNQRLYTKKVAAPKKGENVITFREKKIDVTTADKFYFVVDSNQNASYDGGNLDVTFMDRSSTANENDVTIDESETRQNFADVKFDFGEQGKNGWFYQEGYEDEPFDAYNMTNFEQDEERYFDPSYLEIKRDFVNTGKGRSAIIKWKVAQDGDIRIDAAYTKLKNEDKNPSWPDGTRVTLYHNNEKLVQEEFKPDTKEEITKELDVESLSVKRGDFITMVVNGKENNAYDAGKYQFSIKGLSPLVGQTEANVVAKDPNRTNNASVAQDFGKQGNNGWCFQSGYYLNPNFAVNVEHFDSKEDRYDTKDGVEIKRDFIVPGNKGRSANVKWVVAKDGTVDITADYTKLKNEDKNPSWPDGVTVYLMKNGQVLKRADFDPLTDREVTKDLSVSGLAVKAGDTLTMLVDGRENTAYDGGKYTFSIEDAVMTGGEFVNNSGSNNANLATDFGEQGSNGWYYLEGKNVTQAEILTQKTDDGCGYISRRLGGLEVKKDFVQPRLNAEAMYKWVVAVDGTINVVGDYTKFGHQDPNASWPDGTTLNIYLNNHNIYSSLCPVQAGDGNNTVKDIRFDNLAVKAGDVLTFSIGCNHNNAWDGGRLSVRIMDASTAMEDTTRENHTVLADDFTGEQGANGWNYGKCDWDGKNYEDLPYDAENNRYYDGGKPEVKADYAEPGNDKNAAYRWTAARNGKIRVHGDYTKFANAADPNANGVVVRIFVNGEEKKFIGGNIQGNFADERKAEFNEVYDVYAGDVIMFAINPEGNDSYDGGRLSVTIEDATASQPEPGTNTNPDPSTPSACDRKNATVLKNDFSGEQGKNGWYYGMCEWNGANFKELPYDTENNRYFNNGKPELKADFVEPGNGQNAAYKWVVAKDGKIRVTGNYTKFANNADPNANGVVMRIFVNGEEKKFIGGNIQGNFADERKAEFNEVYDVYAGDVIMFAINPEGNDAWDGGRLEVSISPVE